MSTNVPVGPTTVVGWVASVLGFLPVALNQIASSQATLSGPEKWMAILGGVSLVVTLIGRYLQALQTPALPTIAEEFASPPPVIPASATQSVPPA